MISMNNFPDLPRRGEIALCEVSGLICCMQKEYANISSFTNSTKNHPQINVTRDITTTRDEGVSVYLEVEDALLKRITSVWYKQGFREALKVATETHNAGNNKLLNITAKYMLKVANVLTSLQYIFQPHLKDLGPKLTSMYSHTKDWNNSPVRYMCWHPHAAKLAVASCDDCVRVYYMDGTAVPLLKCSAQRGVSQLAWRPYSATELAVACEIGIIVWTVDPNSTFTKPSASNATILKSPGHSPVTSIGWSPCGSLLASASGAEGALRLWGSGSDCCVLRRVAGGAASHLAWAPDSSRLLCATTSLIFRVWQTVGWQAERWLVRGGRMQVACWSPCSSLLLFATEQEPLIYALKFANASLFAQASNVSESAVPVIDLTCVELQSGEVVGGRVQDMRWSPRGHHLAVTFQDSAVVAVYNTQLHGTLQVTPCCLLSGVGNEIASCICFQQDFSEGACLTIGWSSGRVQHFPIIYEDTFSKKNTLK